MTWHAYALPCLTAKRPQVPADIEEAPGAQHFTQLMAEADLQPAAQHLH